MTYKIAYPHIETSEGQSPRLTRLPRIRVSQIVMDYLAYGWSVDEMYRQHPYLQLSEIYAAMGYYFDNATIKAISLKFNFHSDSGLVKIE